MFGGILLAIKSSEFLVFYDWNGNAIRRIDVNAKKLIWNDANDHIALISSEEIFVLKYYQEKVFVDSTDDNEEAFELEWDMTIKNTSICGLWICDLLVVICNQKLQIALNGKLYVLKHLPNKQLTILAYLQQHDRLYLADPNFNIVSYQLSASCLNFIYLVSCRKVTEAIAILEQVPT